MTRNGATWLAATILLGALLESQTALALPQYEKEFSARLSVEQEYTDNVILVTPVGGEDFISTIRPGFSLAAVSEESGLKLDYDFGYSRYWELEQGFTEHDARGNLWQEWEHLHFDASGSFLRQEYPIELAPETAAIIGLRGNVSPYYRANATPGVAYEFGEERFLRAGYNYAAYWSEDRRFQDSEMNAPNVSLTYALNKFNVLDLGYTYERGSFSMGTFSNTSDLTAHRASGGYTYRFSPHLDLNASYAFKDLRFESDTGYQTHRATLGTSYGLAEDLTLSLAAGYYLIDLEGQTKSGPALSGEVTKKFSRGQVTLGGDWGFGEDYYGAENLGVYEYWSGRASASYKLSEYLTFDARGGYQSNDYALLGRTDDYWSAGGGLSWLIRPWLSARASYLHTDYMSKVGAGFTGQVWNFTVNSYLLSLTTTYDYR